MDGEEKSVIWLVDENEHELRTNGRILVEMLPTSFEVHRMVPYPNLDDYALVLADPLTTCFIIDQKLKVTGIAKYTGIELARYIRRVNDKIPLYILTNFAEEIDEYIGSEWAVEDIIPKDQLNTEDGRMILAARLVRRFNTYSEIMQERDRRFRELLKKSLHSDLTAVELSELDELQFQRTAAILNSEMPQVLELQREIDRDELILEHIESEQKTGREDND